MRLRRELSSVRTNRTGDLSATELVMIILMLVTCAVVFYIFFGIRDTIYQTEDGLCEAQVRAAAATNKVFSWEFGATTKACQTKQVTIRGNPLESLSSENADRTIKRALAEEMRQCWDQWGRGELELFQGEGIYCSFCTIIGFDEDAQNKIREINEGKPGSPTHIKEFGTYLQENKAPQGTYYDEYFIGTTVSDEISPTPYVYNIDSTKNYTVIFYYEKTLISTTQWQSFLSWMKGRDVGALEATGDANVAIVGAAGAGAVGSIAKGVAVGGAAGAATATASTFKTLWGYARRIVAAPLGAIGAETLMYAYMRSVEDYGSISAIYITEFEPNNVYVKACNIQGEPTRSP